MALGRRVKVSGLIVAAVIALGVAAGVARANQSDGDGTSPRPGQPIPTESDRPTADLEVRSNPSVPTGTLPDGRTYGPLPRAVGGDQIDPTELEELLPDLVAVLGDHGKHGYADSAVLFGDDGIDTPQEASEYMEAKRRNGPQRIAVYDVNGTQIDTFTLR